MRRFQAQFQTQWADLSGASILIGLPVVVLFVYSSKYLVSGLALGVVKGWLAPAPACTKRGGP